jgi:hypothetical protein
MFIRVKDQVKPMIPGPVLIIRKFSCNFYVALLVAIEPENNKNSGN